MTRHMPRVCKLPETARENGGSPHMHAFQHIGNSYPGVCDVPFPIGPVTADSDFPGFVRSAKTRGQAFEWLLGFLSSPFLTFI